MMAGFTRYARVFLTFARNSLVRDMTYRANFLIECVTSLTWMLMNLGFYEVVFTYTESIGTADEGWSKYQFFLFLDTSASWLLVRSMFIRLA